MLWLFLKSSNNSCLLLNMKDNLSESCSQNPYTVWVVTSLATALLLSSGKVFIQISIKWAHSCQLDIKFMHLCCNWTNSWLVHVTSTQMNLGLLLHAFCMFHAINLWSSSCTLVQLNCQSLNVFRAMSSQSKCVMACPCSPSELDRSWLQYVVIQQQLLTEELFSQLPMYLLLKHFCNNKMKRRLSTWLLHKLNFEF